LPRRVPRKTQIILRCCCGDSPENLEHKEGTKLLVELCAFFVILSVEKSYCTVVNKETGCCCLLVTSNERLPVLYTWLETCVVKVFEARLLT